MRRRKSVPHTLAGNIALEKAKLETALAKLKAGPEMDAIRDKIKQLETATKMNEWLGSPGRDGA
jgi:hypothetical protein